MESELIIWQVAVIALAAGMLIGILGYRLLAPTVKQAGKVRSDLDQAREELARYRAEVDSHFNKTSELVNDLTQDYVKVYQHLAEGVQTLGNSRSFHNLLEQQPGKVVLTVDDDGRVDPPADHARPDAAAAPTDGETRPPDEEPAAAAEEPAAAAEEPAAAAEAPAEAPKNAAAAAAETAEQPAGQAPREPRDANTGSKATP